MPAHEAIKVSEALSGESTQAEGSDATNDAVMASTVSKAATAVSETAQEIFGAEEDASPPSSPATSSGGEELKEVTLRTAPQDPRFPTTNQSRRCYVAYNEYNKCIKERGEGSGDCKPYMRAYRSICPDEWIAAWQELRENGNWFGKY